MRPVGSKVSAFKVQAKDVAFKMNEIMFDLVFLSKQSKEQTLSAGNASARLSNI